jgi:hypothetical protein
MAVADHGRKALQPHDDLVVLEVGHARIERGHSLP